MENLNFNFEKFVEDLDKREEHHRNLKRNQKKSEDSWSPRRLLDKLYREKANNRIYIKK